MRMLDFAAVIVGVVLFCALAALWSVRPGAGIWLLGTVVWAGVAYPAFMYYVTRPK